MIKTLLLRLFIFLPLLTVTANADDGMTDLLQKMEQQQQQHQRRMDEIKLESMRLEAATDRLKRHNEDMAALRHEREIAESAEALRQEAAEEAEQILADEAEKVRSQLVQSEIKRSNSTVLTLITVTFSVFVWNLIKAHKREGVMKDSEKFGVVCILISSLLILLALMLSEPWIERFDLVQNLMVNLHLTLFAENDYCTMDCKYLIDFPTRYVVFALLSTATYGLTTYLGITPATAKRKTSVKNVDQ